MLLYTSRQQDSQDKANKAKQMLDKVLLKYYNNSAVKKMTDKLFLENWIMVRYK